MSNTNDDLVKAMALALACSDSVADAFQGPWKSDPNILAVFGVWIHRALRHVRAIIVLTTSGDLAEVGEVHYRQLLEIWFQVRFITLARGKDRRRFAHKAAAWGLYDWLEKMKPLIDKPGVEPGYLELLPQLEKFDKDVILEVQRQRKSGRFYWFGRSFSGLARRIQKEHETLDALYAFASARAHGTWALYLNAARPKPGTIEFFEYPDEGTRDEMRADLLERSTATLLDIWNEMADAISRPKVKIDQRTGDPQLVN